MQISECNRFIDKVLFKNEINCSRNLFETFAAYANHIVEFDQVLEAARKEAVDFQALCENHGLDYDKIKTRS